jgi:hypothetical protein
MTPMLCELVNKVRKVILEMESDILELDKIVKLVVSDDVGGGADFGSFTQVFREHRHLHKFL